MDFDPLSRDYGPPRYLVESGSDSDSDPGIPSRKHPKTSSEPFNHQEFELRQDSGSPFQGRQVVVLLGKAGVSLADFKSDLLEHGSIQYKEEQQASIHCPTDNGSPLLILLLPSSSVSVSIAGRFTGHMLASLRPSKVTILETYNPQLYFTSSTSEKDSEPIRYLRSSNFELEKPGQAAEIEVPNTITGLAASIFANAVTKSIPTLLVQIPDHAPQPIQSATHFLTPIFPGRSSFGQGTSKALELFGHEFQGSDRPPDEDHRTLSRFANSRLQLKPQFDQKRNQGIGEGVMYV
ncbi:hypothetical protein IE53DRAFT_127036 [Violaceomyces palustris]|uniref:Uncharacterized protein n=1 Tax=Violaceomyces palustris TaxID=1673888 RepID=A0ACD0NVN3_9BASI|nr:hypothetical protein IE53DRAFT_127036 [Violaceomyces palustris]